MAKSLNFNNVTKHYFTIVLADGKDTTLMIGTPTKAILRELTNLETDLDVENESDLETLDNLYHVCAKVMNRNRSGIEITADYLSEIFDFEDVLIFLREYMNFVTGVLNQKN